MFKFTWNQLPGTYRDEISILHPLCFSRLLVQQSFVKNICSKKIMSKPKVKLVESFSSAASTLDIPANIPEHIKQ